MARKSKSIIDTEITNDAVIIMNEQEETLSRVNTLKKKIQPYSTKSELKETLDKLVIEDSEYIKRYLSSNSNIIYQKDFIINDKSDFLYKSIYNNNSHELTFTKDKILLVINDYTLNSHNYDFILDVYLNGRRLSESSYILDPGSDKYNFTSASKRIFINSELIVNGDFVSVVARKVKKINTFYCVFNITDTDYSQYQIGINSLGEINNNTDNLVLFKKTPTSNVYTRITKDEYACIIDNTRILIIFKNDLIQNTSYIIINKNKELEYKTTISTDYTLEEYLSNAPIMSLDLNYPDIKVGDNYLPLAVTNSKEIDCYIKGLKAMPEIDYTLESSASRGQYIQFKGVLEPGSEVIIRNRVMDEYYGMYKLQPTIDEKGFISLNDNEMPLAESYIEAFDGRRRIPNFNKHFIADTILKVDNQELLKEVEVFSEIDWDLNTKELLSKYNESKPTLTKISDLYNSNVISAYQTNNDIKLNNNDKVDFYTQSEIFLGIVNRVVLKCSYYTITEGHPLTYSVIGYFDNNPIGVDITDQCVLTGFDSSKLGQQTVTVTYMSNDLGLSDSATVEVISKNLTNLTIICPTSFFVVGDKIKESIQVLAKFEDLSEKYVTEFCKIDAPVKATEEGQVTVTATFMYNGEQVTASKVCVVSNTYERTIEKYDVILNKYVASEDEYLSMQIVETFSNDLQVLVENDYVNVYLINGDTKTQIDPEHFMLPLTEVHTILIEQYSTTDKFDEDIIEVRDDVKYKQIQVLKNTLENENKIIVFDGSILYIHQDYKLDPNYRYYRVRDIIGNYYLTIGKNEVTNNAIYFGTIEDSSLVIVEFLDNNLNVVSNEIFKARNLDLLLDLASGKLTGNALEGYTFSIGKLSIGKTKEELTKESITFYDVYNKRTITSLNIEDGFDSITEDDDKYYFNFNDFSTDSGNVLAIRNMIMNNSIGNLELRISNVNLIIKFSVKTVEYNFCDKESMFILDEPENDYVTVKPLLLKPVSITKAYHASPRSKVLEEYTYDAKGIKFIIDSDKNILFSEKQYGKHIYYLINKNDEGNTVINYIEITIGYDGDLVRITKIHSTEISYDEYISLDTYEF